VSRNKHGSDRASPSEHEALRLQIMGSENQRGGVMFLC